MAAAGMTMPPDHPGRGAITARVQPGALLNRTAASGRGGAIMD